MLRLTHCRESINLQISKNELFQLSPGFLEKTASVTVFIAVVDVNSFRIIILQQLIDSSLFESEQEFINIYFSFFKHVNS